MGAVLLTFVTSQVEALTTQDCPPGVPQDKYLQVHGDYCYEFVMYRDKAFNDAQRDCLSKTGSLVKVPNSDVQDFLYDKLRHVYGKWDVVWIGLDDQDEDKQWQWVVDGSVANYTNWAPGQPGGFNIGKELCVVIDPTQRGTWHDYGCTNLFSFVNPGHPYICQYGPLVASHNDTNTTSPVDTGNTTVSANSTPKPSAATPQSTATAPQSTAAAPQPTAVTPQPSTAAPQPTLAPKSTILATILTTKSATVPPSSVAQSNSTSKS